MAHDVTLVLCGPDGDPLGTTAPFAVEWPWWQDAEAVVAAAADNGLDVIVLRLLGGTPAVEGGPLSGGEVTYLAELRGPAPAGLGRVSPVLVSTVLDDHPLRMPWARAGGPSDDLAWATWRLEENGLELTGPPTQIRTWNLSSIWRLATARGTVWLKVVPYFFAHEGVVLGLVGLLRSHVACRNWSCARATGCCSRMSPATTSTTVGVHSSGDDGAAVGRHAGGDGRPGRRARRPRRVGLANP